MAMRMPASHVAKADLKMEEEKSSGLATFVLVHGAWQGGWCWKRVAPLLRHLGHEVLTPTLTGLGERAHLMDPSIDLEMHLQDILGVIESEELSDIVLCGHSYGGMVITGVADNVPDQVRSLVYLDALLPADGQSVMDLLPAEAVSGYRQTASEKGSGYRIAPTPAEAFAVNLQDQAWVDRRSVDQPLQTFEQPIRLQGAWKQVLRHGSIRATGWSPGLPKTSFEKARRETSWQEFSVDCGHYVMVDAPRELMEILISFA